MIYTELAKAEFDLVLFSRMYKHENQPLYLVCNAAGMAISTTFSNAELVTAIALNGKLFVSQEHT